MGVSYHPGELFQMSLLRASVEGKMIIYFSHAYKEFPALFDIEMLVSDPLRPAALGEAKLFSFFSHGELPMSRHLGKEFHRSVATFSFWNHFFRATQCVGNECSAN